MKWEAWYTAARAGNKDAVLTFNDGPSAGFIPITVPSKFEWTGSNSAIMPQYT